MKNRSIAKIASTSALVAALSAASLGAEGLYGYVGAGAGLDNCPSSYAQNNSAGNISMGDDPFKGTPMNSSIELKAALGYDFGKIDLKVGPKAYLSLPAQEGDVSSYGPSLNFGLFARASAFRKMVFGEVSTSLEGYTLGSSEPTGVDYRAKTGFHVPMFGASSGKMNGGFGEVSAGLDLQEAGKALIAKPLIGIEFGMETQ